MTKLTYINDEQIVKDAEKMLIENHLNWSCSATGAPSDDLGRVSNEITEAYLKANYTIEEWQNASKEQQDFAEAKANTLCKRAKKLADKKWETAKTLLGI